MPANELTRDAQIRTIARDVLKVELQIREAHPMAQGVAAFAAGMDLQRKAVQDAD